MKYKSIIQVEKGHDGLGIICVPMRCYVGGRWDSGRVSHYLNYLTVAYKALSLSSEVLL